MEKNHLIITQREGDSFEIKVKGQEPIKVTFLKHKAKQIRLGIKASPDVIIERHNRIVKQEGNQDETTTESIGNR